MSLSSIDLLSPKITLFYRGNNSHISQLGGLLSTIFLITLIIFSINFFFQIIDPQINSVFSYEQYLGDLKYNQSIDYSGINHFIQIYSDSSKSWFGDLDDKNIIIYGINKKNKIYYNDDEKTNIDLYKTEHWVYNKCEDIIDINQNLFSDISKIIKDYSKSICLRYYFNPEKQKYYQIGSGGYIPPALETNFVSEKKIIYTIIVEKCYNNSIFNEQFHHECNNEEDIKKYFNSLDDIFLYFSDNQIQSKHLKNPFEKYFFRVSSTIKNMAYFDNDIVLSPIKIISENNFFLTKKEKYAYVLKNFFRNEKYINKEFATIGIFNLYFSDKIIIYQIRYFNLIEILAHFGGLSYLLFYIFRILNYLSSRYTIIENTKNLFSINTGIDSNYIEGHDMILDKMRHRNSLNYKIKVFNNNNIINGEDLNMRNIKQGKSKNKLNYFNYEQHGIGLGKNSSKNTVGMFPLNIMYGKKNNHDIKKPQIKYTNSFKQMVKQSTLKKKRKSFLSQGYLVKRKDYSNLSKNQSINDNEGINDLCSIKDNNNSGFILLKEMREKDWKEGPNKYDSKNIEDNNSRRGKKKTNLKNKFGIHPIDVQISQINTKKPGSNINLIKGRHKSVSFGKQPKDFLFPTNLLGVKNMSFGKLPSENFNDSSKQLPKKKKNSNQIPSSKFQIDKNRYEDIISRHSVVNQNDDHSNTIFYNANPESYLKTIIQSKIKLVMPEIKKDYSILNFMESKLSLNEFMKFMIICRKRKDNNNIKLIIKFRNKLLSEEHMFKVHINLYLLEKIFQIDEPYKFDVNELYNNL
jgi:hypothetical protein